MPALHDASAAGDLERVRELVRGGADLNEQRDEDGMTPLMVCTNPVLVRYFLFNGANPELKNKKGHRALEVYCSGETQWYANEFVREACLAALLLNIKAKKTSD